MKMFGIDSSVIENAKALLAPPLLPPTGEVLQESIFSSSRFSVWLQMRLEEKLQSIPQWELAHPILLGSWARGELCPNSDLDVLFCGEESVVKDLVQILNEKSLKLRYRRPADMNDWTQGVESFDILALLRARPLTAFAAKKLYEQQKNIIEDKKSLQAKLLKDLKIDRLKRSERYDSIANFLEPNLKYGPGALRDLDQGLQIYEIFYEKFENAEHALSVLRFYRAYFLSLRQKLHIESYSDILVSAAQFDLAVWMGFKDHKSFMHSLQRGLSRVSFYSDWIVEVALNKETKLKAYRQRNYINANDLWSSLKKDPSILNQQVVRSSLEKCFPEKAKSKEIQNRKQSQLLKDFSVSEVSDEFIVAVFRSRLIDKLLPGFLRLVGWVQHDQYHRYPADTHIMQARRELNRFKNKPRLLGVLEFVSKKLSNYDWEVLAWTCLYHDLAKGLEGEHSDKGALLVEKDFKAWGLKGSLSDDVAWMVRNHLELSLAAFRKNPSDPLVWKDLKSKDVDKSNLWRLAIFTAVDIRATNPDAWNDWKARLLADLVKSLESETAQAFFEMNIAAQKLKFHLPNEFVQSVDPLLVSSFGARALVKDLLLLKKSFTEKCDLITDKQGQHWIRFYNPNNRHGMLRDMVLKIYSLGVSIRHASIHSVAGVGVWDWFMIPANCNKEQIRKQINLKLAVQLPNNIEYQSIQIVGQNDLEWVISFKALDKPGLLAHAVSALTEENMDIRSARVHTWGRQVDDLFSVTARGESSDLIKRLTEKLKVTSS